MNSMHLIVILCVCYWSFAVGDKGDGVVNFQYYFSAPPTESTRSPTRSPTPAMPTFSPSKPTKRPSRLPTKKPSRKPTKKPTRDPTLAPSSAIEFYVGQVFLVSYSPALLTYYGNGDGQLAPNNSLLVMGVDPLHPNDFAKGFMSATVMSVLGVGGFQQAACRTILMRNIAQYTYLFMWQT